MLDSQQIALKLFLDAFDVPLQIETIDDRKTLQKVVYLGQLFGPNLGYRFGWYLKGPYSSELADDYYELKSAVNSGDTSADKFSLPLGIVKSLQSKRSLLSGPKAMSQPDWLELLASLHFLMKVRGYTNEQAELTLKSQKPSLAHWIDDARESLVQNDLL